jgi:hypothetical protein
MRVQVLLEVDDLPEFAGEGGIWGEEDARRQRVVDRDVIELARRDLDDRI